MFANHSLPHHEILRPIFVTIPCYCQILHLLYQYHSTKSSAQYSVEVPTSTSYTPYTPYQSIFSFNLSISHIITDQSNVFTRSHRKNGNNNNNNKEKEQSTETPIISENKTISQNAFLFEFSIEQTQSLNIFINEIIQIINISFKIEIFENLITLQTAIANLNNFFKPIGSNSFNSASAQKPIFDNAPYQSDFPTRNFPAPSKRWRSEELRTFDPNTNDVFIFLNRIREIINLRDSHTIQLNLNLQLRKKTKK